MRASKRLSSSKLSAQCVTGDSMNGLDARSVKGEPHRF
jgi:hypothetical protein